MIIKVVDGFGIDIHMGFSLLLLIIIAIFSRMIWGRIFLKWQVVEAEVQLGGIGKVKIKPSYDDIQIAHKVWVELNTRKIGIPFDEKNDVIIEIYNSWYDLFKEIRNLTKQIPAENIRNSEDTRKLINILIEALNDGLRPHLTCWQAKFTKWYIDEIKSHKDKTPQEIQASYPEYQNLINDLKKVNSQLVEYTKLIQMIAHGI